MLSQNPNFRVVEGMNRTNARMMWLYQEVSRGYTLMTSAIGFVMSVFAASPRSVRLGFALPARIL